MRKTGFRLALVMLIGLFAVSSLTAAPRKYSFYLFSVGFWHPYLIAHIHGAQEAASKYPIDLVVVDGRNDPAFQAYQVIQSLVKKPDAILIAPVTEQGAVPALREAKKAGIPVFTTDRNVADPALRMAYVGSSQRNIGNQAGQYAIDWLQKSGLPKPWKIGILQGLMGNIGNTERTNGWLDKINPLVNSGDIKIVADIAGDWSRETTVTKMQELLVKTKDFDVIMASNDAEAAGAAIAMDAAGLKAGKDVQLIGVDGDPDGLQMIKDGKMLATVTQSAWLQGYWAVEMAWKYLTQGGKLPPLDKFPDHVITTPSYTVDKDNVAKFGPFGEPMRSTPTEAITAPPLPY